ncbi:uncharacterized protein LOC129759696 [Uranotaenia lowii]|uniref:uncharacterized protein LOC129759696 n=1 Tax=Uranotaenia lowii TaxID=190385 RepID=UPI0024783B19|nr:uncharacterized protein LOC129759696 [Uranotaenia lowii]
MRPLKDVFTFYDPENKIWCGIPSAPPYNPDQNLAQLVLSILDKNRQQVVQINADSDSEITGAELRLRAIKIAQNLSGRGFSQRDSCVMAVGNGDHTAPVLFACLALAIPVNTLDPSFDREDLGHMLETVRPRLIFCDTGKTLEEMKAACRNMGSEATIFQMDGDRIEGCSHVEDLLISTGSEDTFRPVNVTDASRQTAVMICSSGTTSRSKVVCLSHANCIRHVANFFDCLHGERIFAFSSLYWLSGLMILLVGTLWGATRIITRRPFSPKFALELFQRYRLNMVCMPPSQAFALIHEPGLERANLSSLRLFLCGGGQVTAHLKRSLQRYITKGSVEIPYGLSELGTAATHTRGEFYRDGSVGYARAGMELKIVDDDGNSQDIGQQGEVLIRARDIFKGYLGNKEATEEMIDSEGWLHTGDIGRFDADGLLYIVDRKKDIIKYNNFPFGPTEIEDIIQQVPGVNAACVVGLPTETGSDLVTAFVVRAEGYETCDENRILEAARRKLPDYKQIRGGIFFGEKLPMTPSGKVLRRNVKVLLSEIVNNGKTLK